MNQCPLASMDLWRKVLLFIFVESLAKYLSIHDTCEILGFQGDSNGDLTLGGKYRQQHDTRYDTVSQYGTLAIVSLML